MAIEEHDREDLLRDGTAMSLRGEIVIDDLTIVVGFRAQGQVSLYCGADPVFQFNAQQQLRRVYLDGKRYAADNGVLLQLHRPSQGGRVMFQRQAVAPEQSERIQNELACWIDRLQQTVVSSPAAWRTSTESPPSQGNAEDADLAFIKRFAQWLKALSRPFAVAGGPHA